MKLIYLKDLKEDLSSFILSVKDLLVPLIYNGVVANKWKKSVVKICCRSNHLYLEI